MKLAIQAVALFAFIPLVLFLYLRQPLGPGWSIAAGLVLMFGHRFLAAPWMARHARERCLWCGRHVEGGSAFVVTTGGCEQPVAACNESHRASCARFLTFVARYRVPIGAAIFLPLLLLVVGSLALTAGHPFIPIAWNTWQFKMVVALTVVKTSIVYRWFGRGTGPLSSSFPLHNLWLLGIGNTLWVFRLVGAWWIVAGVMQLVAWQG